MQRSSLTLFEHQREAVRRACKSPRYGHWLDCGLGKTIAMLALIQASIDCDEAGRVAGGEATEWSFKEDGLEGETVPAPARLKTLVVCPKAVMRNAWQRDQEACYPNLRLVVAWSANKHERMKLIAQDADILVTNFETFRDYPQQFIDSGIKRLIVDESSKLKNPDAKVTKNAIAFADRMQSVHLLSGTPSPNDPSEYWSQLRCINKTVSGPTFSQWVNDYLVPQRRKVMRRGKPQDVITGYRVRVDKIGAINRQIGKCSWARRKKDCLDLPEQRDIIRFVSLIKDEKAAYTSVEKDAVQMIGGESVRLQQAAGKLCQLTGGWYYTDDGVKTIGRSKLDTLVELVEELGKSPVIIWANFRHDLQMIHDEMAKMGRKSERLDGESKADTADTVAAFQRGDLDTLVCQPASVGHGVTMTRASDAIFYGVPWSYELYQQARDRIHRAGQTDPCTYWHLLADKTIDEAVLRSVRGKRKGMAEVIRDIAKGTTSEEA